MRRRAVFGVMEDRSGSGENVIVEVGESIRKEVRHVLWQKGTSFGGGQDRTCRLQRTLITQARLTPTKTVSCGRLVSALLGDANRF